VAGPRPTAPEYWNEYAEPWGCIEYTWNGLLNNLLIERVAGIRPNKPGGLLVVEPNLPKGIDFLEIAYPVDGAWTCVAHHRDEHSFLTKVKGATEKVEYHLKLSDHFEVQKVLVDDAAYEFEIIDGQITVVVSNQSDFSIRILF